MRRYRIVRVIARLNIGGPARHVGLLSRGLIRHGFETTLVYGEVGAGEGSFEDLLEPASARAVKLAGLGRQVRPFDDVRAFAALVRLLFRERPDVVHTHTAKAGVLGRVAAILYNATRPRRSRALIVHTYHGHVLEGYFNPLVNTAIRVIERTLALVTDTIVAIAPQQRDALVHRFGIAPAEKVHTVRLGLDLTELLAIDQTTASLHSELGIPQGALTIGFIGRLVPIKDVDVLLRAFASVAERRRDVMLVIAGDGPLRPELEAMVARLGVERQVTFAGWRRDLASLYRTLDIVVLCSRNEGTPVAVIEAMAAGRAVVATDVGGVADVVVDGVTGLLVPARDADRLAGAVERLVSDTAERQQMGCEGRRRAAHRYSHDRLVNDTAALYREQLAAKRGS
jgi:glycosyltransferase involved in cell wall biosynthesis